MNRDIFICSKPLQILNILNVIQSTLISGDNGYLFILENFEISQVSRDKIIHYYGGLFKKIFFVMTSEEVFVNIDSDVRTLVTYSDVGTEKVFIERFNSSKVVIYEEGYSTYHPTFAYSMLLKFKYYLKGYAPFIGALPSTSQIIAYNPSVYSRTHKKHSCDSIIKFKSTFVQTLIHNQNEFNDVFNYIPPSLSGVKKVLLLLLGEPVNFKYFFKQAMQKIEQYDLVIVKGHSYFYNDDYLERDKLLNIVFLESNIPAEYVVYDFSINNIIVDLYHESSTTAIYMKEYINKCTNIAPDNDFKKEYEGLYSLF